MKFSDIPAHEAVKNRLRAMADSGRLPHALLLEGPSGIGKFAMARAFAQYIHCENRVDGEPCGVCPSCRQHETFNHIDTYFSYPVLGGSNTVSDDYAKEWRHFLSGRVFMNFEAWQREFDIFIGEREHNPQILHHFLLHPFQDSVDVASRTHAGGVRQQNA